MKALPHVSGIFRSDQNLPQSQSCFEFLLDPPREMTVEAGGENRQLAADSCYTFAFPLGLSGSHFRDPLPNQCEQEQTSEYIVPQHFSSIESLCGQTGFPTNN